MGKGRRQKAKDIGVVDRLRALLEKREITFVRLAEMTGWDEQRVYRIMEGRTDLSAGDMVALAAALDTTVASLYPQPKARAS